MLTLSPPSLHSPSILRSFFFHSPIRRYLSKTAKKSDGGRVYVYTPGENALDEIQQGRLNEAIARTLQKGAHLEAREEPEDAMEE